MGGVRERGSLGGSGRVGEQAWMPKFWIRSPGTACSRCNLTVRDHQFPAFIEIAPAPWERVSGHHHSVPRHHHIVPGHLGTCSPALGTRFATLGACFATPGNAFPNPGNVFPNPGRTFRYTWERVFPPWECVPRTLGTCFASPKHGSAPWERGLASPQQGSASQEVSATSPGQRTAA